MYSPINSFPKKLQTVVGKGGTKISGGQRQFIAFIRMILQNKSIILLDEPTASLDQKNIKLFINLMQRLKGKTVVIATHDEKLLPLFNSVININEYK